MMLEASGKETRGAGTASATIRATLEPESDGQATRASMHTTMNVTGRPAQFGRGVMVEVGGKLVEQFAGNLSELISKEGTAGQDGAPATADGGENAAADSASAGAATAMAEAPATGPGSTQPNPAIPVVSTPAAPPAQASDDSINLVKLVGPAILKRAVPVAVGTVLLALLATRLRRLFRRGAKS
jgi:hypothetical protein